MLGYESDGDQYDDEDDGYRAGVADISVTLEHFVDVDAEQFGRSFRTTLGHCPDDVKVRAASMTRMTKELKMTVLMPGMMIWTIICHLFAPSTIADS